MSPSEKAKELVEKFIKDYGEKDNDGTFALYIVSEGRAKQCATICVSEIIKETKKQSVDYKDDFRMLYWQQVKTEIQKL